MGLYDNRLVYGQQRVLIMWKRLILPNGSSLSLGDGMPGTDAAGAAGLRDQVNNHYIGTFANALLLSVVGAGLQLSQNPSLARTSVGRPRRASWGRRSVSSSGRSRPNSFAGA